MFINQLFREFNRLFKRISQYFKAITRELIKFILRKYKARRHPTQSQLSTVGGFVLPTVTMVLLVVVLLSIAILLRSFDRAEVARTNVVNRTTLEAALPAIDRARAKLDALFADSTLPRTTPEDLDLYNALKQTRYNFADETRLKLAYDFDDTSGFTAEESSDANIDDNEDVRTAWRFPVDTDNDGQFDTYTLYAILFRNPITIGTQQQRIRNPLEARSLPQTLAGGINPACISAPESSGDWYKFTGEGVIKKSFFVYTVNVPLTAQQATALGQDYEVGRSGFSALELQQDRSRIPLNNNAVWFEGDIELSDVSNFNLNGRVFTNSNLLVAGPDFAASNIEFYQVSDPQSCYYLEENSKIIVAGNVANNDIVNNTDGGQVEIHRFQDGATPTGQNANQGINGTNKSVNNLNGGQSVGNNVDAYNRRIGTLVDEAEIFLGGSVANAPQQVADNYTRRISDPSETASPEDILEEELELYFKERIRKVPYAEVAFGNDPLGTPPVLDTASFTSNDDSWMEVYDDQNFTLQQLAATDPEQLDGAENFIGDRVVVGNGLPERWFNGAAFNTKDDEQTLGVNWLNPDGTDSGNPRTRKSQVENLPDLGSTDRDGFWEKAAAEQPSTGSATGGVRIITGAGIYIDGQPLASGTGERIGGTDVRSFLPEPPTVAELTAQGLTIPAAIGTATAQVVWPDSMPMWEDTDQNGVPNFLPVAPATTADLRGDLQMRATVVYHYLNSDADPGQLQVEQEPSHCVSSYYDPSTPLTARNQVDLPDVSGGIDTDGDGIINILADGSTTPTPAIGSNDGLSNNGVVYPFPGRTIDRDRLDRQASMVFPNGRLVNQPLRTALEHIDASEDLTLADHGAIDSAVCSLAILDGTIGAPNQTAGTTPSFTITHGTIKEATFLDGRQVKSLNRLEDDPDTTTVDETQMYAADTIADLRATYSDASNQVNTGTYTLPLEHRQPHELRVTDLDLNLMRTLTVDTGMGSGPDNNQEYLLPNSGIIYATRDDALLDLSDATDPNNPTSTNESTSPTDFILDPSAKPNAIRLINGSELSRGTSNDYRYVERGLILVTNLPTYLRADGNGGFNLHTAGEEFNAALNTAPGNFWNNFYSRGTSGLNDNFACRNNEPGCGGTADRWRTATVIADAMTVMSNDFKDGFRIQGDFDLRNNAGNIIWEPGQPTERKLVELRLNNGFWYNNFITSADWGTQFPAVADRNSYLTNGVTPIQRRANFPEYLMEVCTILPVSECTSADWDVILDDGSGVFEDGTDLRVKASTLSGGGIPANLLSGTTAQAAMGGLERYARRLAFLRNGTDQLVQADTTTLVTAANELVPLAVSGGNITPLPYNSGTVPAGVNGALWFHTTTSNTTPSNINNIAYTANNRLFIKAMPPTDPLTGNPDPLGQPMLSPMLQIQLPRNNPGNNPFNGSAGFIYDQWLQNVTANTTTYNVTFVSGITPSRPNPAESGAGLHNFVRLMEQWRDGTARTISIAGNFIQSGDSKYATAPFQAADPNQNIGFLYNTNNYLNGTAQAGTWVYRTNNAAGRAPFYRFANRAWGFDVGILSQSPDLFAQRFTSPPVSDPDEFFREVSRDDLWAQTLLCAAEAGDTTNTGGGPNETYTNFALDESQRQGTWCENDITANYPANPNI